MANNEFEQALLAMKSMSWQLKRIADVLEDFNEGDDLFRIHRDMNNNRMSDTYEFKSKTDNSLNLSDFLKKYNNSHSAS